MNNSNQIIDSDRKDDNNEKFKFIMEPVENKLNLKNQLILPISTTATTTTTTTTTPLLNDNDVNNEKLSSPPPPPEKQFFNELLPITKKDKKTVKILSLENIIDEKKSIKRFNNQENCENLNNLNNYDDYDEKIIKNHKKTDDNNENILNNRNGNDDDDNDEYEMVPPDGGWGWLILAGSMLVNILVPGTVKSFGVLFVEFLEAFDATPATAAWIPALCYFLYSSLGPLSSILSIKYSYRTVTLIGGTFAAAGMIISFFASSVTFLYISYGVLVGTGAGLAFPPTVYIVTSYFVRLRGLANGICISGSAFGSIILPPILRCLLENYGYRGAVLIMGGITLNTWVAALFYEPVEKHLKRILKKPQIEDDDDPDADATVTSGLTTASDEFGAGGGGGGGGDNGGIQLQFPITKNPDELSTILIGSSETNDIIRPKFMITSGSGGETPLSTTPKSSLTSPDVFKYSNKHLLNLNHENGFVRSASAVVVQNYNRTGGGGGGGSYSTAICGSGGGGGGVGCGDTGITPIREVSRNSTLNDMCSTPALYSRPEISKNSHTRLNRLNLLRGGGGGGGGGGSIKAKRSPSTSSFQYISTPYHGSTLSFQPQEFSSRLSLKSVGSSVMSKSLSTSNTANLVKKSKTKKYGKNNDSTNDNNDDDDNDDDDDDDDELTKKPNGCNRFLDFTLLQDPAYLVILISNSTNAIGYTNFIILLPAYALALGFDKNYSAYLLSIVSLLDLVGRIGGSALSDWTNFIPKTWYFVGGLAISGIALALLPQATSYKMVSFWCGIFGLASGTYVGITAVIMADMLGTDRLTSSYGISLFVNGILQLIGPPLCGVWFQRVRTYVPLFTTLGCVLLVGASLWAFMPFIHRNRRLKEEERIATAAAAAKMAFNNDGDGRNDADVEEQIKRIY